MKLKFKPFADFISNNTTPNSRKKRYESTITHIEIDNDMINAAVKGSVNYNVAIIFDKKKVKTTFCTCSYNNEGVCKHIVLVLEHVDKIIATNTQDIHKLKIKSTSNQTTPIYKIVRENHKYFIPKAEILLFTAIDLKSISVSLHPPHWEYNLTINDGELAPNKISARIEEGWSTEYKTKIQQKEDGIHLTCTCANQNKKLCQHLHYLFHKVITNERLTLAFDDESRLKTLQTTAEKLGWEDFHHLDNYFEIRFNDWKTDIFQKHNFAPHLTPLNINNLEKKLLTNFQFPISTQRNTIDIIVMKRDYNSICFQLMSAPLAKSGKIKSPIQAKDIVNQMENISKPEEFHFYTAFLGHSEYDNTKINQLFPKIINNPFELDFYIAENMWNNKRITPKNIKPIQVLNLSIHPTIKVKEKDNFYTLVMEVKLDGKTKKLSQLKFISQFIILQEKYYWIEDISIFKVIQYFVENENELYLTQKQFPTFKKKFLDPLEQAITIQYTFIKKAPTAILKKTKIDEIKKHIIYLSESEDYILITPVVQYGDIEVSILSNRTIYTTLPSGKHYRIERSMASESRFKRIVQTAHPNFEDIPQNNFYFLHKQDFIEKEWFIHTFELWKENGYEILGFKSLKNNYDYNSNPMKVKASLQSGIDWFDIHTEISYGKQKVSLKDLQKAIKNKKKYVKLGDGTKGLLPAEWIDKFDKYFRSGEIKEDFIRTHKSQFNIIDTLFQDEIMDKEIKIELENYREKLANFHAIKDIKIPKKLNGTLRGYQKEGLNWLNFLDEFGFGGCLADDMGLGKTIQLITYFLSQIEKGNKSPNLVIVPTSLLHNWEKEIKKFAPKLNFKSLYGLNRSTQNLNFLVYDVIITTYGTMLNDIEILKKVNFNCIVLDESQAIKNPESKRYKAARLLHGRQKIVATGTPVENNTFDLYAQLSFAIPGLFGNARQFAADYSTPIDKFQDSKRAEELQKKVHPFILRRTKKQVATELPEKTEMIIHCEMLPKQQKIYETYKKEFQSYLNKTEEKDLKSQSLHILQGLTKLRQICNSPALLSDDEYYGEDSAKLDEIIRQLTKLTQDHKILVFSQFVSMLELIKTRLEKEAIKYALLTGQTRKRQETIDLFREDKTTRVFLISLKAGGTGLNLTEAEYVFIIDPWWNPAVENQAIDRAYRIGQKNKVIAVRLITPNTIEEKIMELQERKKHLADELIHIDSGTFKKLSKKDLISIV